jgi:hypothetical protein
MASRGQGYGERAKYGNWVPTGRKLGVSRASQPGGHIEYNGHRHVPARLRTSVIDFITRTGRPTTARELATEFRYSLDHMQTMLRYMLADGDVCRSGKASGKWGSYVWDLPGDQGKPAPEKKTCAKCGLTLPVTDFHRDASQLQGRHSRCRACRSKKLDKATVRRYSDSREEVMVP